MTAEPTQARIRDFVLSQFPLARKRALGDGDPLLGHGIIDSFGVLEVVAFIEREFDITVDDEDLLPETFASIATIARFVDGKRAGGSRAGSA